MAKKFKVLIVEDERSIQRYFADRLRDDERFELVHACTLEEADEAFAAHPDIDAILLDGWVPGKGFPNAPPHDAFNPSTLGFVLEVRRTFAGPVIAMSTVPRFNRRLCGAADRGPDGSRAPTFECKKDDAFAVLHEALGIPIKNPLPREVKR